MAKSPIEQFYDDYLGRPADAGGLAFWEAQLANGSSLEQIRLAFARSPEAMQRAEAMVTQFYTDYFGRAPDAAGLAHWVGAIRNGQMTAPDVEQRFLNSEEYRNRLKSGGSGGTTTKPPPVTKLPGDTSGDGTGDGDVTGGTGGGNDQNTVAERELGARNARDSMLATFTWMEDLGMGDAIYQWALEDRTPEAIVALIRQQPSYKAMFVGIRDSNNQMRMNEADYLRTMRDYKDVLGNYGMFDENYDTNAELAAFIEGDVDPNELEDRLKIYDYVSNNSDVLDAFYVYAGMSVTGDELYQAVVDGNYAQSLADEYNVRATSTKLDYDTWITRATEVGLNRLAQQLTSLESSGADSADALSQIRSMDPDIAKEFMTMLHLGPTSASKPLDLAPLQRAFQNALLGSAAVSQGVDIPTADRIEELRNAGVNQAQAIKGYGQYAKDKNLMAAMAARAGTDFSQSLFEEGAFLQKADAMRSLDKAAGTEEALSRGRSSGAFGTQGGRMLQQGLRVR